MTGYAQVSSYRATAGNDNRNHILLICHFPLSFSSRCFKWTPPSLLLTISLIPKGKSNEVLFIHSTSRRGVKADLLFCLDILEFRVEIFWLLEFPKPTPPRHTIRSSRHKGN